MQLALPKIEYFIVLKLVFRIKIHLLPATNWIFPNVNLALDLENSYVVEIM